MKPRTRMTLLVTVLAVGWVFQVAMTCHVGAGSQSSSADWDVPLDAIPHTLGDWRGVDRVVDDPRLLVGDRRLRRVYRLGSTDATAELWMVSSKDGSDRAHHPEVCMAVAGRPEDREGREFVAVDGHSCPVQQFRFGSQADSQWVYYWHYTLAPPDEEGSSALRRLHRRLHWRSPSVTIEVFVPGQSPGMRAQAQEFVRLVDAALQKNLPRTAVRGNQRAPVTVTP